MRKSKHGEKDSNRFSVRFNVLFSNENETLNRLFDLAACREGNQVGLKQKKMRLKI
jgi:hypothetical protein